MAVAGAVLERDAPLPARAVRGRTGEGIGRPDIGGRHRDRAVGGQPARPVLIARAKLFLDQQAAKARTVDKQVARDTPPAFEPDRRQCGKSAVEGKSGLVRLDVSGRGNSKKK